MRQLGNPAGRTRARHARTVRAPRRSTGCPDGILSRVPGAAPGRGAACPPRGAGADAAAGLRPRHTGAPRQPPERGCWRRADIQDRARPGYPPALIDVLRDAGRLGPGSRVADLAAGTGRLSRDLARVVAHCVAVEPSASMRDAFRERVPDVPVLAGSAEAVPLATASVDMVTVAQAFHWFHARRSLDEIARVLRPNGCVALVWNERDESVPWMAEIGRIMRSAGDAPYARALDYLPVLARSRQLTDVGRETLAFVDHVDHAGLVELVASRRYVNVLAPAERAALLRRVADLVASLPEPVAVPYRTEVLLARTVGTGG